MFRAMLLRLPMHPGGALVVNLHAVHSDVALPGFRIARKDEWESDESAAVLRPTFQNRKMK
jgi:hypothetical protein